MPITNDIERLHGRISELEARIIALEVLEKFPKTLQTLKDSEDSEDSLARKIEQIELAIDKLRERVSFTERRLNYNNQNPVLWPWPGYDPNGKPPVTRSGT